MVYVRELISLFTRERPQPLEHGVVGNTDLVSRVRGRLLYRSLLMAVLLLNADAFRDPALKALEHYWDEFTNLEWMGMDLDCGEEVDSRPSYSLTRALMQRHLQQGEAASLDRLADVLHYACSYHFSHNMCHHNPV